MGKMTVLMALMMRIVVVMVMVMRIVIVMVMTEVCASVHRLTSEWFGTETTRAG